MALVLKILLVMFGLLVLLLLAIMIARTAFPLPDPAMRSPSQAISLASTTSLGGRVEGLLAGHAGQSGVLALTTGQQALASRLALIRNAQQSIDAQYYIWHDDASGQLLLRALAEAAGRGVRVRLLLDDVGVSGMDATLMALDALPGVEVRLFNPATIRQPKAIGIGIDFFRMNRRMHNKSLTVDGAVTIVGGRNIGDEYFSVGAENHFLDLDVLAAGAIVPTTAADFDRYWNADAAFPVAMLVRPDVGPLPVWLDDESAIERPDWLRRSPAPPESVAGRFAAGMAQLEWTKVRLVSDDPDKALGRATGPLMIEQLTAMLGDVREQMTLISAYFIPGKSGLEAISRLLERGVSVTILTNGLSSTDVALVHSGYSKYREPLLRRGAAIYEFKPDQAATGSPSGFGFASASGSSLHAKTLAIDDRAAFIGSFNLDPRSIHLNCEMGFLIESEVMARRVREGLMDGVRSQAYRVALVEGEMRWLEHDGRGTLTEHRVEPNTTLLQRVMLRLFGRLPIEWLL